MTDLAGRLADEFLKVRTTCTRDLLVMKAQMLISSAWCELNQQMTGKALRSEFIRKTAADFAKPVVGQGVDPWGKPKLETVWPSLEEAMARAVKLADQLAEQGYFE